MPPSEAHAQTYLQREFFRAFDILLRRFEGVAEHSRFELFETPKRLQAQAAEVGDEDVRAFSYDLQLDSRSDGL